MIVTVLPIFKMFTYSACRERVFFTSVRFLAYRALICLPLDHVRVSHNKTIDTLETEVKKLKSLLSSEKQLRFVSVHLSVFSLSLSFCLPESLFCTVV